MSKKKTLTKKIAKQYIEDEDSVKLGDFTEMEDAAADILGAHKAKRWDSLELWGLTSLSETAAESLSKYEGKLSLGGLSSLSDVAAKSLATHKCGTLSLNGLTALSDEATESLSKFKGCLDLDGLKNLKKFSYPVTRLLQVSLTRAGKGWGELPASQKHISSAIPPEGTFADEPKEWQDGCIAFPKEGNLWDKGVNYLMIAVRWHWSDFLGDQRKARKWFFEKLSDEHSHVTSSSRAKYVISPEAFELWLKHERFWITQALQELEEAKAAARKKAAALAPKLSAPDKKNDGLPSENVLSAKEAANLRKLIKTKTLSKIRSACEKLRNLKVAEADYKKLFPKTRIKELVKHANDEQKLEILDTLAEALEKHPELFEQLQKECQKRFEVWGASSLRGLPQSLAWAKIVASTRLLSSLKNLGDDKISLFLAEAAANNRNTARIGPFCSLGELKTLTIKAAEIIVANAKEISLGSGFKITVELAKILAKFKGSLQFDFSRVPDEIAKSLSKFKGEALGLGFSFQWKDAPGHRKLARTISKTEEGSYGYFQNANSLPLKILKEFAQANGDITLDFKEKAIRPETLSFLTHKCFAESEIKLDYFRPNLRTAQELSKCKAAKMRLIFWTNPKTGLLGEGGKGKKAADLIKETAVINAVLPYEGELQLSFLHYSGYGVEKAQLAFDGLIESKLEERKKTRQKKIKQKSLSTASLPAEVDETEAERKIERLKEVLQSEEAGELGLLLLVAADPWMIELISAGMRVSAKEVHKNEFFETAEDEDAPIGFWLAYARAVEERFHAKALRPIKKIDLKIESEEAQRIAVEEILPRLSFLKELTLTFTEEAGPFCTSLLPTLPELKGLTIRGLRSYSHYSFSWDNSPCKEISLFDLERQSSLESVCLVKPTALLIKDEAKSFFGKIRLQGIYEGEDYGKIDQIDAKSLRKINPTALKVLLFNRLGHGKSKKPPAWWQDSWTSAPVVSDVYGAVEHAEVNRYWSDKDFISLIEFKTGKKRYHKVPVGHEIIVVGGSKWAKMTDWVFPGDRLTRPIQDQPLDLSSIDGFTKEMIQLIYDSAIPVRLRGDALTEELASLLSSRKGPIELVGGSSAILSSILAKRTQATVLDFSKHKLADGTIAAMTNFAGEELTVVLSGTLAKAQATALAGLSSPLVLSCGHDGLVAIPDAVATALAKRDSPTRLRFHRSRNLLGGGNPDHFRISKEAIELLQKNKNFDLGDFGPTMLVKESGKSTRFMQLTTYSVSGKDKMVLETLSGVVGGSSRASSKDGNVYDKKKKMVKKLMDGYSFA